MSGKELFLFFKDIGDLLLEGKIFLICWFHRFFHGIDIILGFLLLFFPNLIFNVDFFNDFLFFGIGVVCGDWCVLLVFRTDRLFDWSWSGTFLFFLFFSFALLRFLSLNIDPWVVNVFGGFILGWNLNLLVLGFRWALLRFYIFDRIYFLNVLLCEWIIHIFFYAFIFFPVLLHNLIVHLMQLWVIFQSISIPKCIQTVICRWTTRRNASDHYHFWIVLFSDKRIS